MTNRDDDPSTESNSQDRSQSSPRSSSEDLPKRKSAFDIVIQGDKYFRWRGGEVSRLESLFDAVIALSLTLIVISVEVPETIDDLFISFQKLPAFAFSFAVLVMCWYYHYLFHRRYGIEDYPLVILNTLLMFLIVSYVYPLKFLASLLLGGGRGFPQEQMARLMYLYSGGFMAIFVAMLLMYFYAYLKREGLRLNEVEVLQTKMKFSEMGIYLVIGSISLICIASGQVVVSGLVYIAIGPIQGINGYLWGRKIEPLGNELFED